MDPIDFYLKNNRKFTLSLLLNAQSRLRLLQLSQGYVIYDDIVKSLCIACNLNAPNSDVVAYAGLMYEAIFTPMVTKKGQLAHKLHQDTIGNDFGFIERLLKGLLQRANGIDYLCIEEMKRESYLFLQGSNNYIAHSILKPTRDHFTNDRLDNINNCSNGDYNASNCYPNELLARTPDGVDMNDDYRNPTVPRIECEKSEPIIRLLAQVRKVGMDILFPQVTHDKVSYPIPYSVFPCLEVVKPASVGR
jgi:hypothetical protein